MFSCLMYDPIIDVFCETTLKPELNSDFFFNNLSNCIEQIEWASKDFVYNQQKKIDLLLA